jgi:hypothetical protein
MTDHDKHAACLALACQDALAILSYDGLSPEDIQRARDAMIIGVMCVPPTTKEPRR